MLKFKSDEPLVSVIIPCYNYGHLLHETLDSLKLQTYRNWECIIVDDGSQDNTRLAAAAFVDADDRYKYIYQENSGVSKARNRGIQLAQGKYVQLLDSDDMLESEKLEVQIRFLEKNPKIDLVYGDAKYFYSHSPSVYYRDVFGTHKEWMPRVTGSGDNIVKCFIEGNIMAINCPLTRKEVFLQAGAFDEALKYNEDWEMFMRWATRGCYFHYLNKENTAALVRIHKNSVSQDKWNMRYQELEMKEALLFQKLPITPESVLAFEVDKLRVSLFLIAFSNLLKGNFSTAGNRFILALKKCRGGNLKKNAPKILYDKVYSTLKKV